MYDCRQLIREEIIEVYNNYMVFDFPKSELKPLPMILKSIDMNQYICYGIFKENIFLGYAYFAMIDDSREKYYLLDYFAIISAMRNKGIGSCFLNLLEDYLYDAEIVLCETELINGASGEEYNIRKSRFDFYLRNNFIDTGVESKIFNVDYNILELNLRGKHSIESIKNSYSELYRSFLPEKFYERFFEVK